MRRKTQQRQGIIANGETKKDTRIIRVIQEADGERGEWDAEGYKSNRKLKRRLDLQGDKGDEETNEKNTSKTTGR